MHKILMVGISNGVRYRFRSRLKSPSRSFWKNLCTASTEPEKPNQQQQQPTFDEYIDDRRTEANSSIVVQVNSEKSYPELFKYCSQFGSVRTAQHYTIQDEQANYILIEFESIEDANNTIDSSCFNEDLSGIPVRSPFLWFRSGAKRKPLQSSGKPQQSEQDHKHLSTVDGIHVIAGNELNDVLHSALCLDDQIQILYEATRLNDLGIRLRFLAARQVENSIAGMFPDANARPFGSSVNGFGKMGCDLDLILRLTKEDTPNTKNSRLVFHTKENLSNGRSQTQRQMEIIGDMLQVFLPGVCNLRRILQARVPIIKFHHDHLHLDIDLSMSNLSGVYMSELLHILGQMDSRVRPLVFCIRRWAQTVGLTNPSPGRWITNFSLTCLIIFFLQQLRMPIIPSINSLIKSANTKDVRITEDGINCTFKRNYHQISQGSNNKSSLSELLMQFYEFYSQFDFQNKAISMNEGKTIIKPEHSPIYIVNPFEPMLNVSKNISFEECERFRIEVRNAAWILETELEKKNSASDNRNYPNTWGLLNLFRTPEKMIIRPNMFFKPRMVQISELFENNSVDENSKIEYKNSTVRKQVQTIKTKGKVDIKQMRVNAQQAGDSSSRKR